MTLDALSSTQDAKETEGDKRGRIGRDSTNAGRLAHARDRARVHNLSRKENAMGAVRTWPRQSKRELRSRLERYWPDLEMRSRLESTRLTSFKNERMLRLKMPS
eukprot:993559-Pleurochrysis_carterae.AAC.1